MIKLLELETIVVKHFINEGLNPYESNIGIIANAVRTALKNQNIEIQEQSLEELTQGDVLTRDDFHFAVVEKNDKLTMNLLHYINYAVENATAQYIAQSIEQKDECL